MTLSWDMTGWNGTVLCLVIRQTIRLSSSIRANTLNCKEFSQPLWNYLQWQLKAFSNGIKAMMCGHWPWSVIKNSPLPPLPPELVALLEEFADVFAKPQGPQRVYDHAIPLLPNTVPVNSRPYRYSPLHKDEIERHVKGLLNAGLITHSKVHLPLLCYWCKKKGWQLEILCGLQKIEWADYQE